VKNSIFLLLLLVGCDYKPVNPICETFKDGYVVVDEKDNYCIFQLSNNPFKEIPCRVAKTCYPEKFKE
jgi:hypothetical protein